MKEPLAPVKVFALVKVNEEGKAEAVVNSHDAKYGIKYRADLTPQRKSVYTAMNTTTITTTNFLSDHFSK